MLGVTGPNEYENNVNNNWYTNYIAKWCLEYTAEQVEKTKEKSPENFKRIAEKTKINLEEVREWNVISKNVYFPYNEEKQVFLQQDGFLDKQLASCF